MKEANRTIGEIVAEDYRTAKVFEVHGIDFCCGGNVALRAVCQEKGIDLDLITGELKAIKHESVEQSKNYTSWELVVLGSYV